METWSSAAASVNATPAMGTLLSVHNAANPLASILKHSPADIAAAAVKLIIRAGAPPSFTNIPFTIAIFSSPLL
jgi:hypothetical protein